MGHGPRRLWIIWAACGWHATVGLLLLAGPYPCDITPLSTISSLVQSHVAVGLFFLAISCLALLAMFRLRWWHVLFMLPQQFVLVASVWDGLLAAFQSHYADGTPCPWQHILADQCWALWACLAHTAAVWESFSEAKR